MWTRALHGPPPTRRRWPPAAVAPSLVLLGLAGFRIFSRGHRLQDPGGQDVRAEGLNIGV